MRRTFAPWLIAFSFLLVARAPLAAQEPATATLRLIVLHDSLPVVDALIRSGTASARTNAAGVGELTLAAGTHRVIVARLGFLAESLTVTLSPGAQTTLEIELRSATLESVVVEATRSDRRIEDEPVRVEVLEREEVEEKMLMTPGDIAMMLNETSGLRVQNTSPSLGGANVRIQGLRGHYAQLLSDGLPLHGGQAGALGLLQIPPMDLQQVEVIKGAASALYGSQALAGVINLVSRRPGAEREREILLNQTSRGGSDGIVWLSGPLAPTWGYTFLGGVHQQGKRDVDDDGWADLPGYERVVVRPRLHWNDGFGRSVLLTAGATLEERAGGTLRDRLAPDGVPYFEELTTRRGDVGLTARLLLKGGSLLHLRASATRLAHDHQFGPNFEDDRHLTAFAEASVSRASRVGTLLVGAAVQSERYRAIWSRQFDFTHVTESAFTQLDSDPFAWLALTASARLDQHDVYGAVVNPRVSALVRAPATSALAGWTIRASAATGAFAPTPFTEETEVTGLAALAPLGALAQERARTGSLDVNGTALGLELNGTLFVSVVTDPIDVTEIVGGSFPSMLRIANAIGPTRTTGAELLARWRHGGASVTGTYTFIKASEYASDLGTRARVALVPRHAVGVVGTHETEDVGRLGLELYYTGRQALEGNPYRTESAPYLIVGFLIERHVGPVRLFLNAENLGDVRQTRFDPLLLPVRGAGGRWTTDAWTELSGRTFNGGVRWAF